MHEKKGGEKMNYYLKKRLHNHISRSDMANMLGLNYNYYYAIERGEIKMPINLIDKFNEIINRGKENEITKLNNTMDADKFWEQMHQKDETGRWELVNKMHEFNINNYDELVALLGYRSVGTIYNYLQGRNPVGDEFKKRLYNFFSDEKNMQIPKPEARKNATYKIGNTSRKPNTKLDRYYEKTDFKKIMRENKITNVNIANAIGVHNSTVSTMTCKKYKPSYRIIGLVKDYLDSVLNSQEVTQEAQNPDTNSYISKAKMLDTCQKEIDEYQEQIETLRAKITEINTKIELDVKLIELIKKM